MGTSFRAAGMELETLRPVVLRRFPELAAASFRLLTAGWDCVAVEVDRRLIVKFPRREELERGLVREAALLARVRPAVSLPVPDIRLEPGPPLFTWHPMLPGEHLLPAQYAQLPAAARERLAADLALLFAELHRLDPTRMRAAGAGPIKPWPAPEEILRRAWPCLPAELRPFASRTIAEWQELPADPHGTTFGFFDGHGWNMAFDHAAQRLNGAYDFGDAGFGPLHQELVYPGLSARGLPPLIAAEYDRLTGRSLDLRRVDLLGGVLRLTELAEQADHPTLGPAMLRNVAEWASG